MTLSPRTNTAPHRRRAVFIYETSLTKRRRPQQFEQIMSIPQALRLAIDAGDVVAIEQGLHELGVLSEQHLDNAFTYAIRNASADTVDILLRHGARLKNTGLSRFELDNRGDPAIYEKLIEHGWDINSTEFGAPWLWYVFAPPQIEFEC